MLSYRRWLILFGASLLALSVILFEIHLFIFHDLHHILIYTIHDIAFLPVEVLLVSLVIHHMLEQRSLAEKLEKLNMVIGTFHSEVGISLLRFLYEHDTDRELIHSCLGLPSSWESSRVEDVRKKAEGLAFTTSVSDDDLRDLRSLLVAKEDFLIRILENPVMLEHESFSEVLRAVFHLTEELKYRKDCRDLPRTDLAHLTGDIRRVYKNTTLSWITYLGHLKVHYPYLYSLSARMNPFGDQDIIVRE